jgi:hypothetical protein
MKAHGVPTARSSRTEKFQRWLLGLMLLTSFEATAASVSFDPPISFFTNIAARLLKSDIGLDLNRIQIYPTNQYSPAVHRVLQVSANLFDATTNREDSAPSVFRPLFTNDNGTVYICGYEEVTNATLAGIGGAAPVMRDLSLSNDVAALQSHDMVYGVPVVVGAKKGWPNFNEFAMQTTITTTRKLEFSRSTSYGPVDHTNQMFMLGISNVFGIEGWNSYVSNCPRPLQMLVAVDQMGVVSNESGTVTIGPDNNPIAPDSQVGVISNIGISTWQGWSGSSGPDASFQVPIFTNYLFLTRCQYQFNSTGDPPDPTQGRFIPLSGVFESNSISMFPLPHWWLTLHSRVRFILVDTGVNPNRIVDYVNLDSVDTPIDVTSINASDANQCNGLDPSNGGEWCTNRLRGATSVLVPTYGIIDQIQVCMGNITPRSWQNYIIQSPVGSDISRAIAFFNFQFGIGPSDGTFGVSNVFNAPFSPFRNIIWYTSWSANDPLVHYTVGDLINGNITTRYDLDQPNSKSGTVTNLGRLNVRYEPWGGGGNPVFPTSPTKWDLTVKDPAIFNSDSWSFPTNLSLDTTGIGQVHRGTPWQTIYLKSAVPSANTWFKWAGPLSFSTFQTNPTNDWHLVSWLVPLLNTNAPGNLLSVNEPNTPAWAAALDGIIVQTNSQSQLGTTVMSSNSPQATTIGQALVSAQAAQPAHYFRGIGDILATPPLSVTSPWLNLNVTNGITDQAYEAIPSQLLPRLRPDSVGSIAPSAGGTQIQFTGFDDWRYALQVSSNFRDWTSVSTNSPFGGVFSITNVLVPGANLQFYRTLLVP